MRVFTHCSRAVFVYIFHTDGSPDVGSFGSRHPAGHPKTMVAAPEQGVLPHRATQQVMHKGGHEMITNQSEDRLARATATAPSIKRQVRAILICSALALLALV